MKNPTLKSMLLANIDVNEYDPIYRKTMLLNIILMATALGFGLFFFLNIFLFNQIAVGVLDFIAFTLSAYAIYHIRKSKDIKIASLIASFNLLIFLLILVYMRNGEDFTLIWTIFLPITTILVNGSKRGLLISTIFYAIVFTYLYSGIDLWQSGSWNMASYIRFVGASILLVYIVFLFEQSFEKSFIVLSETRKKEQEYLNKLQVYSVTDSLTELFNRKQLDILFDRNFDKAQFNKSCFAFFILDLDEFKLYNDTYGHVMGDEVLKKVSNTLKQNMKREADSIFRLGGEEFCGLLMASSADKILISIENIRIDIEQLNIKHSKSSHGVITGSFGVCIIEEFDIKSFDKMYDVANNNLSIAKQKGRNSIVGDIVTLGDIN